MREQQERRLGFIDFFIGFIALGFWFALLVWAFSVCFDKEDERHSIHSWNGGNCRICQQKWIFESETDKTSVYHCRNLHRIEIIKGIEEVAE